MSIGDAVDVFFYDPQTGVFDGRAYKGPLRMVQANTPPGAAVYDVSAIEGFDWRSTRVDVATGLLADYQPPVPNDEEGTLAWSWNSELRRWESTYTDAFYWKAVRAEQYRLLLSTDWLVVRAAERGEQIPQAWRQYRQQIRDITLNADPRTINWPPPPDA